MIPNCKGCNYEFEEACWQQKQGFHLATSTDWPRSENICSKGHLGIIIVDDNGKKVMW